MLRGVVQAEGKYVWMLTMSTRGGIWAFKVKMGGWWGHATNWAIDVNIEFDGLGVWFGPDVRTRLAVRSTEGPQPLG